MTSQDSRVEKECLSVGPLRNKSLIMVLPKSKVLSVRERLVCESGVMCYLWHGSLLPSPNCLVYFCCLCSRSPLCASLEEFNRRGASTSPVCGRNQGSRSSLALPGWGCFQASWQHLYDGDFWDATGLRGPVF